MGLKYATVLLGLTVLSFWAVHGGSEPRESRESALPSAAATGASAGTRSVAFDNLDGNVERVTVYVAVDGQAEQVTTATCVPKTCTFELPLTEGRHDLLISVEHDGKRSDPAKVTLDTRAP